MAAVMERIEGVRTRHASGYTIDVVVGDAVANNHPALIHIATFFAQRELGWTEASAAELAARGLSLDHIQRESEIPSVFLFRKEGAESYGGISIQRLLNLPTQAAGLVPLLYNVFRGFEPEYRGTHMGRDAVELAPLIHREAKMFAHRTGSPVAALSTSRAESIKRGSMRPWNKPYDLGDDRFLSQQLLYGLFQIIRFRGRTVDGSLGVSKEDYPEYNHSYMPDPNMRGYDAAMEMLDRMQRIRSRGGLGMNLLERDSVIVIAELEGSDLV